jgi:hypothetical protein
MLDLQNFSKNSVVETAIDGHRPPDISSVYETSILSKNCKNKKGQANT